MVLLLAFSLTDRVEKYGAYVGVVAFFGLAVLTILYFAQARELKRLREWAGRAPERAREDEERVVAQAEAARRVQAEQPAAAARAQAPVPVGVGAATAAGAAVAAASPAQVEDPQATQEHDVVQGPVEADGTAPGGRRPGRRERVVRRRLRRGRGHGDRGRPGRVRRGRAGRRGRGRLR